MELGSTLAHDDLAGGNELSAEALHAETLGYRLTAVLGASSTFLMWESTWGFAIRRLHRLRSG
jgi:hypothetical protein